MPPWLAFVGAAAGGLFSGNALYISTIEHPSALSLKKEVFWPYVRTVLPKAVKVQGSLAAVSGLAALGYAFSSKGAPSPFSQKLWATAGALMLANWPFSIIAVFPVNARLLSMEEVPEEEKEPLYRSWGQRHTVRTVLGVASFGIMVFGLMHMKRSK